VRGYGPGGQTLVHGAEEGRDHRIVTGWAEGERREGQVCREVYLSKEVVEEEKDASEAACVGAVQGVERGRAAGGAVRETRRRVGRPAGKGFPGGKDDDER